MRPQEDFDRRFGEITRDDPELRSLARNARHPVRLAAAWLGRMLTAPAYRLGVALGRIERGGS